MSSKFPAFSHIFPRNGVHGTVNLFVNRDVVNDLDSLQVLIIVHLITNDVVFTQKFGQRCMDFERFDKIGVHFRAEELSEVKEVFAVDFL
jgi:hypothetical protein